LRDFRFWRALLARRFVSDNGEIADLIRRMAMSTTMESSWPQWQQHPQQLKLFYFFGIPFLMAINLWYRPGDGTLGDKLSALIYFSGLSQLIWLSLIASTYIVYRSLQPLKPQLLITLFLGALLSLIVFSYPIMFYIKLSPLLLTSPIEVNNFPFWSWDNFTELAKDAPPRIIAWMTVNLFYERILDIHRFEYKQETLTPAPELPAFIETLPDIDLQQLLAVEAYDHYIKIHTAEGSEILHYRFRDAVNELAKVPGLQVHRSWWVAQTHQAELIREKQSYRLQLNEALDVPISRTYIKEVREQLLVKRP
jgi:hypothetical protein